MDSLLMNNSKKLFSKLYKSDKKLENINSNKAIILVGAKRMGKSTSYNWITGTKLIGVEEEEGGQVIYNVGEHVKRNKIQVAEIKPGDISVTSVPNISILKDDIVLIDLAGFGDNQADSIQIMTLSYILKIIFEKIKLFKILFVIEENEIQKHSKVVLKDSLSYFSKIFKYQNMNTKQKQSLIQSISILVTMSEKPNKNINLLKNFSKNLTDQFQINLLANITLKEKICVFPKAIQGKQAEQCDILSELQKRGWSYFTLQKQDFIFLPYNSYDKKVQKDELSQIISKKLEKFKQLPVILYQFVKKTAEQINNDKIDYINQFKNLKTFIESLNYYDLEIKGSKKELKNRSNKTQNQIIKDIFYLAQKQYRVHPKQDGQQSKIYFKYLKQKCSAHLVQFEKVFCRIQSDRQLIMLLETIIHISFRQFLLLNEIEPSHTNGFALIMRDAISFMDHFNETSKQIYKPFMKNILNFQDKFILQSKSQLLIIQYLLEKFSFYKEYNFEFDAKMFLIKSICTYHLGRIYLESQQEYKKSLKQSAKSQRQLLLYKMQYNNDKSIQNQKIKRYLGENFKNMIKALQKIEQLQIVLQIGKLCCQTSLVCNTYQILIQSKKDDQRIQYLQEYAEYCCQNFRQYDGIKFYQQILDYYPWGSQQRQNTIKKFTNILQSIDSMKWQYKQKLLQSTELPEEQIIPILNSIQSKITNV